MGLIQIIRSSNILYRSNNLQLLSDADPCNGFYSSWKHIALAEDAQSFPINPYTRLTVKCESQTPGIEAVLAGGDTVITCKTGQTYHFETKPRCFTLGKNTFHNNQQEINFVNFASAWLLSTS